jgi:hypothetical protein
MQQDYPARRCVGSLYIFLGRHFRQQIQQVESEGIAIVGTDLADYV